MAEDFSLQIVRNVDDYRALLRQNARESRSLGFYRWLSWGFGIIAFFAALGLTGLTTGFERTGLSGPQLLLSLFAFFGLWWTLLWIAAPLVRDRFYPTLRLFRAPALVAVRGEGVQIAADLGTQFLAWPAISDLVETNAHIFLRVDGASAITIPKRAFESGARASDFIAAIRGRLPPA
jgi:hypothetical protein